MKMIHILEGLQHAEHVRMLNVYGLQSTNEDRRLTVRELEIDLGIPTSTMSEVLTEDLVMKCVVAKFIPWLLLPEQKEHHAAVADDMIQTATKELDFLKKEITRDEP